ncbi:MULTISPECIES: Na/Pi symporter [Bacillaceae]|uniref:Na/Pi symporter n=1 Tax=Evansella alkalicola TaxID=745819 RepID=A0ABS6JVC7_9BACI|nr:MULTISPECIES: Na/Pi symporter [Bacillaceae]MBU9722509.1 Na/Pi symporter [Bacillus alkalicola]
MNQIISLFAIYIALFLFGMTVMRQGLLHMQRGKMASLLEKAVDHPLKSLLIGLVVTAILQSSSAVMIMTVGLVAGGLIPFKHSIGIILGANIGTVVTLEIIAFDLSWLIFPLILIGIPLLMTKSQFLFCLGCLFFGFSSILIAMNGFGTLAYPLSSLTTVYEWIVSTNEHDALALTVGVVISAIIQSSSAVTAIAMSFMNEQLLNLPAGISIMIGANLGTCMTAWLASLGGTRESKLTAYAHIWVNLIGVTLFFPFIAYFAQWVGSIATMPSVQLAHAALVFNLLSSLLILPFINHFSKFVTWMHGGKKELL